MKKILALLLASMMVLGLAACGGESTDTTDQNETTTEGTETPKPPRKIPTASPTP